MAQAFVVRNDLHVENADNPVRVVATYRNDTLVDLSWHGDQCTVLGGIADNLIYNDRDNQRTILTARWRDDYVPVVNAEAFRRINAVFPQYKQMNYTARHTADVTAYGPDITKWPQGEQDFKAEYDRGWAYVAAVRTVSNSFTAMPADPTDDSLWPTPISPVK